MWSPERGGVGDRIFRDADDERETKEISIEDTAYWFSENNGKQGLVSSSSSGGGGMGLLWPASTNSCRR
jgi:hypothetical protein